MLITNEDSDGDTELPWDVETAWVTYRDRLLTAHEQRDIGRRMEAYAAGEIGLEGVFPPATVALPRRRVA